MSGGEINISGSIEEINSNLSEMTGLKPEENKETGEIVDKGAEASTDQVLKTDKETVTNIETESKPSISFDQVKEHYKLPYESEADFLKEREDYSNYKTNIETNQSKYTELESSYNTTKAERDQLDSILKEVEVDNPLSFLSEAQYKALKLSNDNPHLDSSTLYELASSDLNQMDGFDVMVKHTMMKNGGKYSQKEIMQALAESNALDFDDMENWTGKDKLKFELQADKARDEIKQMMGSVELPQKVNLESIRAERQEAKELAYKDNLEKITKAFEGIKTSQGIKSEIKFDDFNYDFNYDFDEGYREDVQQLVNTYAENGLEPNEELQTNAATAAKGIFLAKNIDKILKTVVEDAYSKFKTSMDKDLHNPNIHREEAPNNKEEFNNETFIGNAPFNQKTALGL